MAKISEINEETLETEWNSMTLRLNYIAQEKPKHIKLFSYQ